MPKDRAVFMDRDGTLVRDVPYCSSPDELELLPGVPEAIKRLNRGGFKAVVVTNQSGVGRGYFDVPMLKRINDKMAADLAKEGARLDGIYYCPHLPEDNCDCRKPRTALLRKAAADLNLDLSRSFMVGDMLSDVVAGQTAGCRTCLVSGLGTSSVVLLKIKPHQVATSLAEAADWILGQ